MEVESRNMAHLKPFDTASRSKIFEEWLAVIQAVIVSVQSSIKINQEKQFNIFQSVISTLEGKESYSHFQILDELIPVYIKKNFSSDQLRFTFKKLRDMILKNVFETKSSSPETVSFIIKKNEDIESFIEQNYQLHSQINKESDSSDFIQKMNQLPFGIFQVTGKRLEGKSLVNKHLAEMCSLPSSAFSKAGYWKLLLHPDEYEKIRAEFNRIYSEKQKKYEIDYYLKIGNNAYQYAQEEGIIEYDEIGSPIKITGYIFLQPQLKSLRKKVSYEQKKYSLIQNLSYTPQIICDESGKIVTCNQQFAKIVNVNFKQLMSSDVIEWFKSAKKEPFNSFKDFVGEYFQKKSSLVLVRINEQELKKAQIRLGKLESPEGKERFVLTLNIIEETKQIPHNQQKDSLTEFKELLSKTKDITDIGQSNLFFEQILNIVLKLIPNAKSGHILKVSTDKLSFIASNCNNIERLRAIDLLGDNIYPGEDILSFISGNINQATFFTELIYKVKKDLPNHIFSELTDLLKLNEIKSAFSAAVQSQNSPLYIITIASIKDKIILDASDKILFDLIINQLNLFLSFNKVLKYNHASDQNLIHAIKNSINASFLEQSEKLIFINSRFTELTGFSQDEIQKKSIWQLIKIKNLDPKKQDSKNGNSSINRYEFNLVDRNGANHFCEGHFVKIKWKGQSALFGNFKEQSVTEEFSRPKSFLMPGDEEDMKLPFSSIYDFSNIFKTIYPASQAIMLDPTHPKTQQRAEIINNAVHKGHELSKRLLRYSQIHRDDLPLTDLNGLLKNHQKQIQSILGKSIKFNYKPDADLPPVRGKDSHFLRIILNLIRNAKEAIQDEGAIEINAKKIVVKNIDCKFEPQLEEGKYFYFSIEDSGQGIPENIKHFIFDTFFTTKSAGGNFGLGLSEVYAITQLYQGIIRVSSEPGIGSKFELFFPLAVRKRQTKNNELPPLKISNKGTILAVDDEDNLRSTTKSLLEHLGFKVYSCAGGMEAVKIYREKQNEIDVVLLDYIMPEFDGKKTFRKLKEINPAIKIIMCSGYAEKEGVLDLLQEGLFSILPKPYSIETISQKLDKVFQNKKSSLAFKETTLP